jgi:hypothetical protein
MCCVVGASRFGCFWYEFEGCMVPLRFVSWYGLRGGVGYEGKSLEAVLMNL